MKTVIKFLTLTLMLAAFGAISAISTNAQATEEVCKPLYDKFLANRKGPAIETYEVAISTGKEFLEKCSTWEGQEEAIKYVTAQVPKIEKIVVDLKKDRDIFQPFNKSVPAKDWATSFRTGKLAINENPNDVDVTLILASIGFDRAIVDNPPVDTYNADTISLAKSALQKMEQGGTSGTGNFGALGYAYKTAACADGKTNAIGWMNYTIGAVMFNRMNQKKEALPYLYKATQVGCETKDKIANIYRTIGSYYVDEFKRIEAEKNAAYKVLTDLPSTTDPGFPDAKKKYDDLVALQKGYMERVMDAYARAYKAAVNNKETPAFSNGLLARSKEFYKFRNGDAPKVPFDSWMAALPASFPDPTSAVTPIVEAEPTTAPTAMTAAAETPASNTSTDRPRTVPAATTKAATTTTTTKPAAATTTTTPAATTTTKAPAKKPVAKKKP